MPVITVFNNTTKRRYQPLLADALSGITEQLIKDEAYKNPRATWE